MVVGTNIPITPQLSAAQKWVECATTDEVVADMLIRFDKEPSWHGHCVQARTIRTLLQALSSCVSTLKSFDAAQSPPPRSVHA
jgi:hypothetical protein